MHMCRRCHLAVRFNIKKNWKNNFSKRVLLSDLLTTSLFRSCNVCQWKISFYVEILFTGKFLLIAKHIGNTGKSQKFVLESSHEWHILLITGIFSKSDHPKILVIFHTSNHKKNFARITKKAVRKICAKKIKFSSFIKGNLSEKV